MYIELVLEVGCKGGLSTKITCRSEHVLQAEEIANEEPEGVVVVTRQQICNV